MMMKEIEIFTDGACRGNPGPGGWGALLRWNGHEKRLKGAEPDTTNNRMEMMAAIESLRSLKQSCKIKLTTDSQYLRRGVTEWLQNWKRNNWRNSQKKPVKNKDLWQALESEIGRHEIIWLWVKGHSGHIENELADQLANEAIDEL
jgi:ribonuclease HI